MSIDSRKLIRPILSMAKLARGRGQSWEHVDSQLSLLVHLRQSNMLLLFPGSLIQPGCLCFIRTNLIESNRFIQLCLRLHYTRVSFFINPPENGYFKLELKSAKYLVEAADFRARLGGQNGS